MKKTILLTALILLMCSATVFGYDEKPTGGYVPVSATAVEEAIPENGFGLFSTQNSSEDGAETSYSGYYGYDMLLKENEKYAKAYVSLINGMKSSAAKINIYDCRLTVAEVYKVFNVCINDCPQLFHVSVGGYSYEYIGSYVSAVIPNYITTLKNDSGKTAFEDAADAIIEKSGARSDMSDYDKAIILHNELAMHVEYNRSALNEINQANSIADEQERNAMLASIDAKYPNIHSAYGALVEGDAVCDGYSKAYQYILRKMGIESHIATGTGKGGAHAWNLVKLDGKWYYTDVTWDDAEANGIFYEYLNMNDEKLADSAHVLDGLYAMPVCNSSDLNYFEKNGGKMTANGDLANVIAQLKENFYARVYVTGDNPSEIWNWYKTQLNTIGSELGLSSAKCSCVSLNDREYHLFMYYDAAKPLENAALEIASPTDKIYDVFAAFYDENDAVVGVNKIDNAKITANSINVVKCTNIPEKYKKIKYFIWNSGENLLPLHKAEIMTY